MNRKIILITAVFLFAGLGVLYAKGDGGPLIMACDPDFSSINDYIVGAPYNLPRMESPVFMWGGSGISWLNDTFGLGMVIAGGYRTSYKDNLMARYFGIFTLLQLKNVIVNKPSMQTYLIYGPGIISTYLGMSGTLNGEFISYNMLFYVGLGMEFTLSETTSLEIRVGYNVVPSKGWDTLSGSLAKPNDFSGRGLNTSLSLFFGG
jgi:hypothetical protein